MSDRTAAIRGVLMLIFTVHCFAQSISYVDVAADMNILHPFSTVRGSISLFDFDRDGLDDFSFTSEIGEQVYLYQNSGSGFVNIVESTGILDTMRSRMIIWVDFDNDGDRDLFIANDGSGNSLYRNDGSLQFYDISELAGVSNDVNSTNAACWGDYNNDGWLDLYVTNYSEFHRNYLYKNDMNGGFIEVGIEAGVTDSIPGTDRFRNALAVSFLDYDNDGWQDIYIANDKLTGNTMLRNSGDGTFVDVSESTNTNVSGFMMAVAIGDYDNNGYLDIYSTNDREGNFLLTNNGNGTFTEMADSLGVAVYRTCWGANFFDADNDGDLDLFVCVSNSMDSNLANPLFENNGDNSFTERVDAGFETDHFESYGHSIGDFDNNGYYDITVFNKHAQHNLYQAGDGENNWIKLNLEGSPSNRDGIGTRLEFHIGSHSFIRSTHCGISYMSQNSATQTIGIGTADKIDSILVRWPSGTIDRLTDIAPNQLLNLVEGEPVVGLADGNEENVRTYSLMQNYPNPFNPSTVIRYSLFANSSVQLEIFNISGQKIKTAIDGYQSSGSHEYIWDGKNDHGQPVASGGYFYRLEVQSAIGSRQSAVEKAKKMLLVR